MVICPDCGHDNIDGADACEQCGQSLLDVAARRPESDLERSILEDRIGRLAVRKLIEVRPETPVADVLSILAEAGEGCAVISDEEHQILGIFTERDALMKIGERIDELADRPIASFMTENVGTLNIDDPIVFLLHRMDVGGYRHVPILVEGKPAGIVSVRDVLRYLRAHLGV
ncbi:MAG: CBS domain-containing protein [Planctomycetota bacterium]|nr:MAG: CBS domain-containing protein [Planctomycetota bacterium]